MPMLPCPVEKPPVIATAITAMKMVMDTQRIRSQ